MYYPFTTCKCWGKSSLEMCCVEIICFVFSLQWYYTSPSARWGSHCKHRRALEQEAERTGTHKTQTTSPSLTESWCRVIWKEQVRNLWRRRDALFRIIGNSVIPIGLIVRVRRGGIGVISIRLVEFSGSGSWLVLLHWKMCGRLKYICWQTLERRSLACVGGRPVSKSQRILQ